MATASSDLAARLDDPGTRAAAAMALGRRGAWEYAARIAAALLNLEGRDRTTFAVALEQLGDPSVVPALLPHAGDWDVHHALTGSPAGTRWSPTHATRTPAYGPGRTST